ncbi:aminotransferase class IV [Paenibacillus rubinfantis]|uniref:aminotransferase class IV n=1 Tax=Paenibacillus rubinfantis TaxID=1720296 RepID=UPI00073E85C7|nr:aminotransferase class IV [Paenibacillus rubinfantis]
MKYIGVDGVPTPADQAVISVMDHGFMYGLGLFETFRTYGGRPFLLERHLERLASGCRALGIGYQADPVRIEKEIAELLERNGLAEGYIRYTVTAGEGPLGLPAGDYDKPKVVIYVKPLPEPGAALYTNGKPLWRLATPRNTPEGEVRFKSLHYMNNVLAKRELARLEREVQLPASTASFAGQEIRPLTAPVPAEGLQLTPQGWLAEGIVSNVFFVRNGQCYTPGIETGILPGITRAMVLELATEQGIRVEEGLYTWDELWEADEVFLTNSIQELVPVTELVEPGKPGGRGRRRRTVGTGRIGAVTERLLGKYREKARSGDATDHL